MLRQARHPQVTQASLEATLTAIGRLESRLIRNATLRSLHDAEFKVFSQFGEDGIIQYLIQHVPIANDVFVELGVGDYTESNTRFLLVNNNWRGLIVDCGTAHTEFLKRTEMRWRYSVEAETAFLTRDNVNAVLRGAGLEGDVGLLSIDIDGNDYWLLNAIDAINPRIVVVEYNSVFGWEHPISIPYDPNFNYVRAHYSTLYFGTSLAALCFWARGHGYSFVGSNSAGCNAFFVRNDVRGDLPELTAQEGYVPSRFRASLDEEGNLTYIDRHVDRLQVISGMEVLDVVSGNLCTVKSLFGL